MPGANCAIFGCGTCRRAKYSGVALFKVPRNKDPGSAAWREQLISVITRDRVIDSSLKKQIQDDSLYICERHFDEEQYFIYGTRKRLKDGQIPSKNLPRKSIASEPIASRSESVRRLDTTATEQQQVNDNITIDGYQNLAALKKRTERLQEKFEIKEDKGILIITKNDSFYALPKFQIFVTSKMQFEVRVFGWLMPSTHDIIRKVDGSLRNITITNLTQQLESHVLCKGLESSAFTNDTTTRHIIPLTLDADDMKKNAQVKQTEYLRHLNCHILIVSEGMCDSCKQHSTQRDYVATKKQKKDNTPAHPKAPVSMTSPNRLKLTLQMQRLKCSQLESEINNMKLELLNNSTPVTSELNTDLKSIITSCDSRNIPPFMKLFWEEQQKYIMQSSKQVRYHPQVIKFCLAVAAKSPAAYSEMRYDETKGTGVLILPSSRRLRSYRNIIKPQRGFNHQVIQDLEEKTKNFSPSERFVVLSFDEMKVQEDLVWDKNTGELIGFVDLGDANINDSLLKTKNELASHILVFMIKSVVNPLSHSFATFATAGVAAPQLFALFWKAVSLLEMTCSLKVVAAVGDGASCNRKFFKMHKDMAASQTNGVVHRTINLYALDRFIYFISDAPHLIKTARNCLYRSGKASTLMWKDGQELLWRHLVKLYEEDAECGLKLLPKISAKHIYLTSYSKMNVRLAVQTLSETVSGVLKTSSKTPSMIVSNPFSESMRSLSYISKKQSKSSPVKKSSPSLRSAMMEMVETSRCAPLEG